MSNEGEMFPQTRWSQLARLKTGGEVEKREVQAMLYQLYRRPVLAYLARRGFGHEKAEDLVQDFFLHAIQHQLFEKAETERGRFRGLMLSALQHYAANAHRREQAQQRRPAGGFVAADEVLAEGGNTAILGVERQTPEDAFTQSWARMLLARVVDTLDHECQASGKQTHFEIFKRFMLMPILDGVPAPSQREMATEFGLTEKEVANRLVTARRAYQRLLREEIAQYAKDSAEVDAEIRDLFATLSRPA
jgi:RNA polymerase sigma factor (sigma-70 family)